MTYQLDRVTYLMGRDKEYPTTEELEVSIARLLHRVNSLLRNLPTELQVTGLTSGYRPGKYNEAAGGSPRSAHLTCEACDLGDPTGKVAAFLLANQTKLQVAGLYMEHPSRTKGWVHLQTRKTTQQVFLP